MKRILSILGIAAVMASCTSTTQSKADLAAELQAYKDSLRLAADTAGLADYRAWKAQNELVDINAMENAQLGAVAPVTNRANYYAPARSTSRSYATRRSSSVSRNTGYSRSSTSGNTAYRKRGWSKAAKGAVIGAGTGAVAGAIINKRNRVVGGVVGGVIGGGVGYGIGRGMDKRDGRY